MGAGVGSALCFDLIQVIFTVFSQSLSCFHHGENGQVSVVLAPKKYHSSVVVGVGLYRLKSVGLASIFITVFLLRSKIVIWSS